LPVYSHSQLSAYETCPFQYKLAYIDKVEAETEGIEAFMGSRVHEALDRLYRDLLRVEKRNPLEEILSFYHHAWDAHWNGGVQIVRNEYGPEDYRRKGERCLVDYYGRYSPFDQGRTLGLEEYITFPLDEGQGIAIRGYVDRIVLVGDDVLEIHDYKSSGRLPSQADLDGDRQLSFYQMGVEAKWKGFREVRLVWHFLSFNVEMRSSRTPEALQRVRAEAMDLIGRIESDLHFLPKEGPLCEWCNFQALCPKRRHRAATRELAPEVFSLDEGVALVRKFADLSERKRLLNEEIDAELAGVEEALLTYGSRMGEETIFGEAHVARIRREVKEKYPLKGDPRRRALEDLLRKAGKWGEVSDFNPWMLARVIERTRWDPLLVRRVRDFVIREETTSIQLSKRTDK
jgi:putative RecB family exonuclease